MGRDCTTRDSFYSGLVECVTMRTNAERFAVSWNGG